MLDLVFKSDILFNKNTSYEISTYSIQPSKH